MAARVIEIISATEERFKVVPQHKVRQWLDENPHWADHSFHEIGEHFGVDYVYFIEIGSFALNEEKNHFLLRGKTDVLVTIHDVAKQKVRYQDTYQKTYPAAQTLNLTDVHSEQQFRRAFLEVMANELAWYVVPHREVDARLLNRL